MPPRLSKRQQREQEELEALAGPSKTQSEENVTDDRNEPWERRDVSGGGGVIGFAALAGEDDAIPESEDDELLVASMSKKSKKKKKKQSVSHSVNEVEATPSKPPKRKPKTREVSKLKASKDDDFEKALAELSEKRSSSHTTEPSGTMSDTLSSFNALNNLFCVSLRNLDPETELRRFFGSKVITSTSSSRPTKIRSHLVRPQPTWPPAHYRAGLSMRALTSQEVDQKGTGVGPDNRERWWTFEASPRYKGTTYEYLQCVMGGDPQLFYNLMHGMPWHADTLLQMAEVFRHREEYSTAADFMSRALFAYERAFSGAFNLTTGIHRLDFDHVENRVFFLALARNVIDLNRRGTPRTAFEFARLLLTLEPHTDPHGALLHLDYLAIKAGQAQWLLGVWDAYANMDLGKDGEARFDVTILPGWCWSRALALFEKEDEGHAEHLESTQALKDAILAFPSIAPLLSDKIDLSISPELRKLDAFKIVTDYNVYRDEYSTSHIHLLSHIYATRSSSLWKTPERAAWLLNTLNSLNPSSFTDPMSPRPRARLQSLFSSHSNITEAIYRHVIVVSPLAPEFRRLTVFLPTEVTNRLTQTIEGDPLPPVTAVSVYDDAYFSEAVDETRRGAAGHRMADLPQRWRIPLNLGQLQAMFDAHPEIVERLREEGVDIDQLAGEFPAELMEAVMGRADQAVDGAMEAGRMPGGEVVFEHDGPNRSDDEDVGDPVEAEGSENEDEDEPFFPVRVVQNIFSRLWRRTAETDEASGSDSDRDGDRPRTASDREGPRTDDVD
ncbi:transcriptional repressor TCF25-domain-containing protein [Gautieria morchelliformis]|nr:transcriptional repressor TCF25-domain-containing protein [Gautieria morchelliformis]